MADQQQDAVVPALPPLPAGFERVVIGEQQRAGTGGASVRQHFLHRGVTVGEGRVHVHHTREIVSAERIDGRAGGAIPKSTARVPAPTAGVGHDLRTREADVDGRRRSPVVVGQFR